MTTPVSAALETLIETDIEIFLDDTVKDNSFFQGLPSLHINRPELFKYGIMMWEVPPKIKESDFDYLQNKVPALELQLSDFIEFTTNSVLNLSNDDRNKKTVSEVIGVAFGLKYSTLLLKTNPNKFKKIGAPVNGKYLDYSTIVDKKEYEIETKGTVSRYYSSMKNDIIAKKENHSLKPVHLRYGTISMIKNPQDQTKSQCVIVDDPPSEIEVAHDDTFITQLWNYAMLLSYILDSKYYNKYVKPLQQGRVNRVRINDSKFFGKYNFDGKTFYGECYDYRLIKSVFQELVTQVDGSKSIFKAVTQKIGKTKFFIGIEESIIKAINKKDKEFLKTLEMPMKLINTDEIVQFLDKDGILVVKAKNGSDRQIEIMLTDDEVEKRLGLYTNYILGNAHQCKAPCTSREIVGKPCEKMTFREHCHFHR